MEHWSAYEFTRNAYARVLRLPIFGPAARLLVWSVRGGRRILSLDGKNMDQRVDMIATGLVRVSDDVERLSRRVEELTNAIDELRAERQPAEASGRNAPAKPAPADAPEAEPAPAARADV